VDEGGLLIGDITVGPTVVSDGSSTAPFRSPTQIKPTAVANWDVKLVGIRPGTAPIVQQIETTGKNSITMSLAQLAQLAPAQSVVAVVAYDEPTELVQQYAPYALTVNGTLQPGGRHRARPELTARCAVGSRRFQPRRGRRAAVPADSARSASRHGHRGRPRPPPITQVLQRPSAPVTWSRSNLCHTAGSPSASPPGSRC